MQAAGVWWFQMAGSQVKEAEVATLSFAGKSVCDVRWKRKMNVAAYKSGNRRKLTYPCKPKLWELSWPRRRAAFQFNSISIMFSVSQTDPPLPHPALPHAPIA